MRTHCPKLGEGEGAKSSLGDAGQVQLAKAVFRLVGRGAVSGLVGLDPLDPVVVIALLLDPGFMLTPGGSLLVVIP